MINNDYLGGCGNSIGNFNPNKEERGFENQINYCLTLDDCLPQVLPHIPLNWTSSVMTLNADRIKHYDNNRLIEVTSKEKISPEHRAWGVAYALINLYRETLSPDRQKQLDFLAFQAYSRVAPDDRNAANIGMQITPQYNRTDCYHRFSTKFMRLLNKAYRIDMRLNALDQVLLIDSFLFREVMISVSEYYEIESEEDLIVLIDGFLSNPKKHKFPLIDMSMIGSKKNSTLFEDVANKRIEEFNKLNPDNKKSLIDIYGIYPYPFLFTTHLDEWVIIIQKIGKRRNCIIRQLIAESGFCLSPDKAKKAFLKIKSLSDAIDLKTNLATNGKVIPVLFKSINDFVKCPVLEKFKALSDRKESSPNVKILAKATVELIEGLAAHDIDAKFENELKYLLQTAYFVIINSMNEGIFRKDDFIQFNNQIELIHQALQLILEIAQPYKAKDFSKALISRLQKRNLISESLDIPKVYLKASGMRALFSVISSIEKNIGSEHVKTVIQKNSYRESIGLLGKRKLHQCEVFEGDVFKQNEAVFNLKNLPIDIFLCEFHHNCCASIGRKSEFYDLDKMLYEEENTLEQIKWILKQNNRHQLHVIVDNTIGLESSKEMKALLEDLEIQNAIKSGILNLIFIKSAQKYDMLGQDNYYGGIAITFNNSKYFEKFTRRMDDPTDQLDGINLQGLAHIHSHAGFRVDDYQKAILENSAILRKKMNEKGVFFGPSEGKIQFAKIIDPSTPFLHFKGIDGYSCRELTDILHLSVTYRGSFGFPNANITEMLGNLRFTIGLESEEVIDAWADFFAKLQKGI